MKFPKQTGCPSEPQAPDGEELTSRARQALGSCRWALLHPGALAFGQPQAPGWFRQNRGEEPRLLNPSAWRQQALKHGSWSHPPPAEVSHWPCRTDGSGENSLRFSGTVAGEMA